MVTCCVAEGGGGGSVPEDGSEVVTFYGGRRSVLEDGDWRANVVSWYYRCAIQSEDRTGAAASHRRAVQKRREVLPSVRPHKKARPRRARCAPPPPPCGGGALGEADDGEAEAGAAGEAGGADDRDNDCMTALGPDDFVLALRVVEAPLAGNGTTATDE